MSTGCTVEPLVGRVGEIGDAVSRYYRGVITKMIPRRPVFGSPLPTGTPAAQAGRSDDAAAPQRRRRGAGRAGAAGAGRPARRARRRRSRGVAGGSAAAGQGTGGRVALDCPTRVRAITPPCEGCEAWRRCWLGARCRFAERRSLRRTLAALVPQVRPPAAPELRDRFHEAVTRGLSGGRRRGDRRRRGAAAARRVARSCSTAAAPAPAWRAWRRALHVDHARGVGDRRQRQGLRDQAAPARRRRARARQGRRAVRHLHASRRRTTRWRARRRKLAAAAQGAAAGDGAAGHRGDAAAAAQGRDAAAAAQGRDATAGQVEVAPTPRAGAGRAAARAEKMFPWRPVAIASLVVGVVGIAVGAPLVAIDGNPTCNSPEPKARRAPTCTTRSEAARRC